MNKNLSPALEILLMALICCIVAGFLFRSDGGINLDTLVYVRNSISFPSVESNIFPPGYSILIKSFNVILKDNFWSTKAINFFFLALILGFSWVKQFWFCVQRSVLVFGHFLTLSPCSFQSCFSNIICSPNILKRIKSQAYGQF